MSKEKWDKNEKRKFIRKLMARKFIRNSIER